MERIDRLGWAAGLAFASFGVRVGIRVSDPEVLRRLPPLLPPGSKLVSPPTVDWLYSLVVGGRRRRSGPRRYHLLYSDGERLMRTLDLDQALRLLEIELSLWVAEAARRRVFVHAGVIAKDGRAILIPGRSLSGKTTLVTALLDAGASYYSDEYAPIDLRGRVHPYPVPLGIRKSGSERLPAKRPVESVGGVAGTKPLPVGLVVVTRYRPGVRWRSRQLSPGQAVLELLDNTLPVRRKPKRVLDTLLLIAAQVPVLKGTRGEAKEIARRILEGGWSASRDSGAPLRGVGFSRVMQSPWS